MNKWKPIFDATPQLEKESNEAYIRRIAEINSVKFTAIKIAYYKLKKPKKEVTHLDDLKLRRESGKVKELERKYNSALKTIDELEMRYDALIQIKESIEIKNIEYSKSNNTSEAIPIIQLSDWHFEERIDPQTINYLNEYNLEIATQRWNKCIQNSLKLVYKERQSTEIKQLIVWLGGDFITGYIHEELEESNYLSPTQATRFAKEKIITALNFYLQYGKFEKITVVCNYGNHGRTNKKPRIGTSFKNSYEWMMYKDLEDMFQGKLDFIVPNGLFAYVNVDNYCLRFWHGDTIKYGGGIGGLTVPLIKAISRYDGQMKADYNFMGHFHQLFQATKNCIVNGSGIGFNAYAQAIGASPEEPMQGFSILDKKRGLTIKTPIFCK